LQTAVAKRLQKLQQRTEKKRERGGNDVLFFSFMDTTNPTKKTLKKEKEKSYVPSKHHQYLVSIIKIPKMTKMEKKEARLDRGT